MDGNGYLAIDILQLMAMIWHYEVKWGVPIGMDPVWYVMGGFLAEMLGPY